MKSNIFVVMMLILVSRVANAQETGTAPSEVNAIKNKLSLGLNVSYYHPQLDDLNAVFASQEQAAQLPPGREFNMYYLASASLRYQYASHHVLAAEFSASISQFERGNFNDGADNDVQNGHHHNLLNGYRIYMAGVQYRYIIIKQTEQLPDVFAGVGAGWIVTNFFRDYPNNVSVSLLKDGWYGNVGAGAAYMFTSNIGGEIEARYLFVPAIHATLPATDVKLSSVVIGAGIVVKP